MILCTLAEGPESPPRDTHARYIPLPAAPCTSLIQSLPAAFCPNLKLTPNIERSSVTISSKAILKTGERILPCVPYRLDILSNDTQDLFAKLVRGHCGPAPSL